MKSSFSQMLTTLRREHSLSQRQAALELGVSQALLSHYENGVREPRFDFVLRACEYYSVTADQILGRGGPYLASENLLHGSAVFSEAERELLSALDGCSAATSAAAANYSAVCMKRATAMVSEPNAPYNPALEAEEKLAEAALLDAARKSN